MGGINTLTGKLIDDIEWIESAQGDVVAWRFPRYQNEIRMGAKLSVRPGQNAVFGSEGRLADVYQPGTYRLGIHNMPILKALMGWKYGFDSPFNADVYFVSTRQWTHLKWRTLDPITKLDSEIGHVRIWASGTYAVQVADPKVFLEQAVLSDPSFELVHSPQKHIFEISDQLHGPIVSQVRSVILKDKTSLFDLDNHYETMSSLAQETIASNLATLGLDLKFFSIDRISLPAEVEQARHSRSKAGVVLDMRDHFQGYNAWGIDDALETPVEYPDGDLLAQQDAMAAPPSGPPPIPLLFYIVVNGTQTGPYPITTLSGKAAEGTLARETLVWREGMETWTPADALPELQPLFAAIPPRRSFPPASLTSMAG
jgi:membrane protease subunit (stomatin/prohibitin family)